MTFEKLVDCEGSTVSPNSRKKIPESFRYPQDLYPISEICTLISRLPFL